MSEGPYHTVLVPLTMIMYIKVYGKKNPQPSILLAAWYSKILRMVIDHLYAMETNPRLKIQP